MLRKLSFALSIAFLLLVGANTTSAAEETAKYKITFQGSWTKKNNHPSVSLPGNAHFSPIIGAVHNKEARVWEVGGKATKGFTLVAELGQTGIFSKELKSQKGNTVASILNGSGNLGTTQKDVIKNVRATKTHHLLSLATMIAPSHDWFIGVSHLSLKNDEGKWKDKIELDLFAYDAGTELGEDLALGPDRKENGKIRKLTGVSYLTDQPFGRILIERVK